MKWIWLAVALVLLELHASYYMPFIADDALISLRYAQRLIEGKGLTWTEGRRVEGYSNLLWLLLNALMGRLGVDLILSARILGFAGMSAAVATLVLWYTRLGERRGGLPSAAVGSLFFVSSAPVAVWAIGGLEQPLCAALLGGVIPLYYLACERDFRDRKSTLGLSLLLGLLCLTRPDGPLFTVAIVASALIGARWRRRRWPWAFVLLTVSFPVLFYGGQTAFRLAYYGEWAPNTALVKITPSLHLLVRGVLYVSKGFLGLFPLSIAGVAILCVGLARPADRQRFLPLAVVTLLWLGYLVAIGGDSFLAHRHLIPVVVVLAYVLSEGTRILLETPRARRIGFALVAGAGSIVLLVPFLFFQFNDFANREAKAEIWEWKGKSLALVLKQAFSAQAPLLAVTAAGCLPYWSELPCLDMLGLNDYYLPRHKPADVGSGELGHELGDAQYVLRRAPDIIVFFIGLHPMYRFGEELSKCPEFRRRYAQANVWDPSFVEGHARVFFRSDSEKIGIRRGPNRIVVPAYFLDEFPRTIVCLRQGRMVAKIDARHPAGIAISESVNDWNVEVKGPRPGDVESRIETQKGSMRIVLTTRSATPVFVEEVVLTRRAPVR